MPTRINHDNVSIVLKKPRYPENIGATARAMCNMGFSRLVLIDPENPDPSRMKKTATHEAASIIDGLSVRSSTREALESFEYVVGTTARLGKQRRKAATPSNMAEKIVALSRNNRIAIVFGPEDRGLDNDDIACCDALIHIPTYGFTSINLAQAVMVLCYELSKTHDTKTPSIPKLAGKQELDGMYGVLDEVLDRVGYRNPQKPDQVTTGFKDFFSRITLRSKEVIILRTFLSKIMQALDKN